MKNLGKIVAVACLMLAGCTEQPGTAGSNSQQEKSKSDDGINVEWPGGSFTMSEEGDIKVRASGVDVDVESGQKVDVRAPGVDVDVKTGDGVDVRAPGVDVRADKSSVDVKVGEKRP